MSLEGQAGITTLSPDNTQFKIYDCFLNFMFDIFDSLPRILKTQTMKLQMTVKGLFYFSILLSLLILPYYGSNTGPYTCPALLLSCILGK